jgi:hypothetical protein
MFTSQKTSSHWYSSPIFLLHILVLGCWIGLLHAAEEIPDKDYSKLEQKLKTTMDPIGKTKTLIQMSDFQLRGVIQQAEKSNFAKADQYLSRYRAIIRQTQEILISSGRNAQKNPTGFKEFELALRRQLRALEDLRSNYPYEQAEMLRGTIEDAKTAKESMLVQIFGEGNFGKPKEAQ